MTPKEMGAKACLDGKLRDVNPFSPKAERASRIEWLEGYAEQARAEAEVAIELARQEQR